MCQSTEVEEWWLSWDLEDLFCPTYVCSTFNDFQGGHGFDVGQNGSEMGFESVL